MSETTKKVDFAAVQAKLKNPVRDKENPHFKSHYVSRAALLEQVRPVLNAAGYTIRQGTEWLEEGRLILRTIIEGPDGFVRENYVPVVADRGGPQGMGSAQTYASRYGIELLLGLAGEDEEDDDGNAAQASAPSWAEGAEVVKPGGAKKEPAERTAGGATVKSYNFAKKLFMDCGIAIQGKKGESDEEQAERRDNNLMAMRMWLESHGFEIDEQAEDPLKGFAQREMSDIIDKLKAEIDSK